MVNFVVCRDNNGQNGWQDTPQFRDQVDLMFQRVNEIYSDVQAPGYNVSCPVSFDPIEDTRIRFELNEIYFIDNSTFNTSTSGALIVDWLHANYPESQHQLNHVFSMPDPGPSHWGYYSNDYQDEYAYVHTYHSMYAPEYVVWDDHVGHIAHEYGHALGLHHMYNGEEIEISNFDFLDDVFGTCGETSCCTPPPGEVCYLTYSCFFSNQPTPHPIMNGGVDQRFISPKQGGRMHRALSLYDNTFVVNNKFMHKYVKEISPYSVPLAINSDEVWDFKIKMYQNILVKTGNTLTIKCEVMMPNDGKIIVEPGAKLVIDGGHITNFYHLPDDKISFWSGIEVHGNYQLRQNTSNQGVVEVINDGIIEYARNGIRTIGLNESGTFDWSKTGGIVRINGGVFKDCRRGIEFMSYHNLTPTGNESSNVSYIFNTEFITTDEYLENQFPYAGITMYDVTGVRVRNTIFENQKTDLSSINNTNRGSGIISIDANYNATSGYNWQTGAPIAGTENEFRNLYYGVMTYGGTGRSDVKINDNLFEECIYGVGLMGCNYGIIGRNQFNILEFNNDPINPIGFGVYTDGAYGFNIEGNNFDILGASTNVNHHAVNVRNSSNNTSSGKVYRNNIDNIYLGTQTIGNNTALRIDCNDYVKGAFSTVDFNHADGTLADQGDCGQFSFGVPINNTFSGMCNNTTLAQLFKSPSANPFVYSYQAGSLDPSCHNLSSNAVNCLFGGETNECPVTLANNAITIVDARISLWKSKLGGTKESLNTVREIIAYGDREELDLTIEDESNELSKDSLLAASPYLSDRILIEYLTQSNTPPSGHIKQVLLANSPLTDTVLSVVNGLNLPNGINNQISQAQTGISERRLLEASESNLNTDRLVYIDAIVQEYLDTNWVDSAALFLREEGSVEALCALVPIEVRRNDTIRANSIIDTLRTVASGMESSNTSCKRACELNEFCDFQQFVFRIALRQGGYFSINQGERTVLEQVANSDARVAVNAKAILHFIDQTLPMYKGKDLVFPKSMNSEDDVEKLLKQEKEEQLFTVHPNPTSGNTVFTIETEEMENLSIIITNFQGKIIKILDVTSKQVNYNLGAVADGTYLVHLVRGDAIQSTSKLIYAK